MEIFLYFLDNALSAEELVLAKNSLFLIFTLPIIATIVGVFRHIVGLKSISIYAPIILTYAFYELGFIASENSYNYLRGLQFGIFLFAVVLISSILFYEILRQLRMHYIPKSTIVLAGTVLSIILSIFFSIILFEKKGLIYVDIFAIIMVIALTDSFVSTFSRKELKYTFNIALQTLITGLIGYTLISLEPFRDFVMEYALLILIFIVILNFFIGKFTGLRFTEYLRFWDLLILDTEEENVKQSNEDTKKQ